MIYHICYSETFPKKHDSPHNQNNSLNPDLSAKKDGIDCAKPLFEILRDLRDEIEIVWNPNTLLIAFEPINCD